MQIFSWQDINKINKLINRPTAICTGSFDGPHLGHLFIFNSVINTAKNNNFLSVIITFKTALPAIKHPEDYKGDIATLSQRLFEYEKIGFDIALVIDFNEKFMQNSGEDFFLKLKDSLKMKFIAEGIDFRCGYKGTFTKNEIIFFAKQHNITAEFHKFVLYKDERISSSIIRQKIYNADFEDANNMLGHPYSIDLNDKTFSMKDKKIIFQKNIIKQVIPKNGLYYANLIDSTKTTHNCFLHITENELIFEAEKISGSIKTCVPIKKIKKTLFND